jgi:UDP-N-acetylmuramate dehydrogenase
VLVPTDPHQSKDAIEGTIREREKRHLQDVRAAGSFFLNPNAPREIQKQFEEEKGVQPRGGRVPAGWLIEKAGLKGAIVGGAEASSQHPNYLVNRNNATAKDVLDLAAQIKAAVKKNFGIELQEEAALF